MTGYQPIRDQYSDRFLKLTKDVREVARCPLLSSEGVVALEVSTLKVEFSRDITLVGVCYNHVAGITVILGEGVLVPYYMGIT